MFLESGWSVTKGTKITCYNLGERKSFMHVGVPASHGTEICAIIIKAFRPPLDTVVVWIHTFFGPSLNWESQFSKLSWRGKGGFLGKAIIALIAKWNNNTITKILWEMLTKFTHK